ncbi:MAG: hypothetical protein HQK52_07810 [Oligoflexia bacterium]|nr:hypothetical protein [Oligoflexia bacterium]
MANTLFIHHNELMILQNLFSSLANVFSKLNPSRKKSSPLHSFTFYIPAPPLRKRGYREKEFDKLFHSFFSKGYELISINTTSHNGPISSGMWIVCIAKALKDNHLSEKDLNFPDIFSSDSDAEASSLLELETS